MLDRDRALGDNRATRVVPDDWQNAKTRWRWIYLGGGISCAFDDRESWDTVTIVTERAVWPEVPPRAG